MTMYMKYSKFVSPDMYLTLNIITLNEIRITVNLNTRLVLSKRMGMEKFNPLMERSSHSMIVHVIDLVK